MEITYLGHSSFLLRRKQVKLLTDPFSNSVGFKLKKQKVDVVTISHDHEDHNDLSQIEGNPLVIAGPGEYEIHGVMIEGFNSFHDNSLGKERGKNTIYVIDMGEMRLVHLGDLGHQLTQEELDVLDGVDVLMAPVGGSVTLEPEEMVKLIKKINPSIVIPMHYKTGGHSRSFDKLIGVEEFVKLMEMVPKNQKKLKIKKSELPEEMELVILEKAS